MDIRVNDIDTVFVDERGIGAFPSCNSTTAVTEGDRSGLDPGCPETVEEIGFSCHFAVFEVGIA
jgi:hypothetical protein